MKLSINASSMGSLAPICAMVNSRVLLGMGDLQPLIGILIMGIETPTDLG